MLIKILKVVLILGAIAAIPLFWMNLDAFGIEPSFQFYVTGLGASLFLVGFLYKMLGSFDLIPDWIPLLGSLDDKFAWLAMLIGAGATAFGLYVL